LLTLFSGNELRCTLIIASLNSFRLSSYNKVVPFGTRCANKIKTKDVEQVNDPVNSNEICDVISADTTNCQRISTSLKIIILVVLKYEKVF